MIISRTPLRVSFAGGGSDLAAYYKSGYGSVVSTAIDKYVYITVNRKFDDLIRVSYSKTEIVNSIDEVEHNIIRESLRMVGVERGVEVVYMGDIPLGSAGIGLGSSSGLAVGVLNALYAYHGRHVSAETLARQACEIEIDILKCPIGRQDQYITAYGGLQQIRFNHDESVFVDPVICQPETRLRLNRRLMLFYTGMTRISSDVLAEQQENTGEHLRHLRQMVGLSEELAACLQRDDLSRFGRILHEGWVLKRDLASGITNAKIDDYYARARGAGAVGGKILGAGGGGFLLLYCEESRQDGVRRALADLKESPFRFEPQGSKIIYVSD